MGSQKNDQPVQDVLVFREVGANPEDWVVRPIPANRLKAFLDGGWKLLLSEDEVRATDIEDTYRQDRDKPFNPPRKPQG